MPSYAALLTACAPNGPHSVLNASVGFKVFQETKRVTPFSEPTKAFLSLAA
jgi:hypothetical protein